jgi:hypothetical protein
MMLPPLLLAIICFMQARVVRNAPSRWIASIFFQSEKLNSSMGCTIWMPALLIKISMLPKALIAALRGGFDLHLIGDIYRYADCFATIFSISAADDVSSLLIQIGDYYLCALTCKFERDLLADTAGRTGDECNLTF